MTKITGKRDHRPALVAALTLLGASLGISTQADGSRLDYAVAANRNGKSETTTTGTHIKGATTSWEIKGDSTQTSQGRARQKGGTTSNQYKEHAPSAMFLKNVAPVSNQQKADVHSNQSKIEFTGGVHGN